MAFKNHNPGYQCCECVIHQANFYIESEFAGFAPTTGATWGGGTVGVEVTGVSRIILSDTPHPSSPYKATVWVDVTGEEGSECRVYLSWDDGDGFAAQVSPGVSPATEGTLYLYHVSSGTDTLIKSTSVLNALVGIEIGLKLCYDPSTKLVTATCDPTGGLTWGVVFEWDVTHTDAPYAGFGTGPSHAGTASFNFFSFERYYHNIVFAEDLDECGCYVACVACDDRRDPDEWVADLDGLESYQSDCSDLNRAYTINTRILRPDVAYCQRGDSFALPDLGTHIGSIIYGCEPICDCYDDGVSVGFYDSDCDEHSGMGGTWPSTNVAAHILMMPAGSGVLGFSCPGWTIPAGYFAVVFALDYSNCKIGFPVNLVAYRIFWGKEYPVSQYGNLACLDFDEVELTYRGTTRSSTDHDGALSGCSYPDYGWEFGKEGGYSAGGLYYPDSASTVLLSATPQ